jgi:dynein heavy chain
VPPGVFLQPSARASLKIIIGELDYWRTRLQWLTSIIKQLKTRDSRNVIGVLSTVTKGNLEYTKSDIMQLLRRWKQVDIGITEATNEAKDNVKYLSTLERLIEPLYSGTVATIIDTFPAFMNLIKVSSSSQFSVSSSLPCDIKPLNSTS